MPLYQNEMKAPIGPNAKCQIPNTKYQMCLWQPPKSIQYMQHGNIQHLIDNWVESGCSFTSTKELHGLAY